MKFNTIISNPPYAGRSALHQQFFNGAVNQLVDGGSLVFIQPATPYHNKKDKKKQHEDLMIKNLKRYIVDVKFVAGDTTFPGAFLFTDLSITTLSKTASNELIRSVQYKNNMLYRNVQIENINVLEIDPIVYQSIDNKIREYISKNGALHDIIEYKIFHETFTNDDGIVIPSIRANFPRVDAISIVTKREDLRNQVGGMKVLTENEKSFNSFAESFIARMGLMLSKYNQHNERGEMKTVPLVPFDRHWTDEELAELIGLTDEELNIIRSVLPDYHGLLK